MENYIRCKRYVWKSPEHSASSLFTVLCQVCFVAGGSVYLLKPACQRRSLSPLRIPTRNAARSRLVLRTHLAGAEAAIASQSGKLRGSILSITTLIINGTLHKFPRSGQA